MQLPSWWLLACLPFVLIGSVRAQCPPQMPSACECQAVNGTVRWTCSGDFDQSKVAFHAAQNQLDELALLNCKQPMMTVGVFHPLGVRSLEISSCGIVHVHQHAFDLQADRLEELVLQNNSITEFPSVQKLTKLKELNLNGNKISTIPEKAFLMTQLEGLRLERNDICEIPINALAETARTLELLDLSDNCLSAVPATNIRPLRRLMYLDLAGNQIAELPPLTFHAFPQLLEVRLTKNKLRQIPGNAFSSLPVLEDLVLRENRLSAIEDSTFQGTPGLQKLDLGHNELAKVPSLGKLDRLKSLRLDSNRIDRVESGAFANHPLLEVLNLADNQIATVVQGSFGGLKQLVYLLLNNNAIKTIDSTTLKDLSVLERLKLRNNSIVDIDKSAFASAPLLRVIDLAQNRLQRVKAETFSNSVNLTWLDLSRNEISMLDEGVFSNEKTPQLKFLFLNSNPLNCDAKFDWFFTYITTQNLRLRTSGKANEEAACAAPEKYANLPLRTVVLRKADERLTDSMQALGLSKDGVNPLLKQAQHNSWLNTLLPALTGNPSSVGNTQSLAFLNSLLKSVPNEWRTQLQEVPGMGLLRTGTDNILPDGDRALEEVIEQFSEPLVKAAKGFDMTQDDLIKLLKSIPEIVKKLPKDSSLGTLEDAFVQTVFDGKGISDPAKQAKVNALAQRYAQQLSAAAAKAMGMPFNETLLSDSVNATRVADKLKSLPVTFIDGVLHGTKIPFLTAEETLIVKDYLSKSIVPATSSLNVTDLLASPEMMKLAKLLPPGTNLTQIPSSVLEDIKIALRSGKLPSIESVLSLPPDIVESLRRKVEELSAVPEEELVLPDNFDLPPLEEHERVRTTPPYDINSIDSELVIKDKDNAKRTWIIAGSIIAALSVFGIGMAAYLVWRCKHSYKVSDTLEMQRANTTNQTRTSSTVPAGFRPKFTSTLRGDGPLMSSNPSDCHSDATLP